MIKVMFVCLGNICRSPMAEFVLKDMVKKQGLEKEFYIKSSATKRKAVKLRVEDYKKYDYIIGMEKSNVINIKRIVGEDVDDKIYRLLDFSDTPRDIADPWYTGNFEITFNDIVEGCNGFLKCLKDKNIIDK